MQSAFQNTINLKAERLFLHQQDSFDNKEFVTELRKYPLHIYLICRSPKIMFDDVKTEIYPDKIKGVFYTMINGVRKDIPIETINNPLYPIAKFEAPYPHNIIRATAPDGTEHSESKTNLVLRSLAFQNKVYLDELSLEVLYVGQAFGENGKRITIDRLRTHEKAQAIYFDTQQRFPDHEVWFLSITFNPMLITMFKPWGNVDSSKFEDELEHQEKLETSPIPMDQQITVVEAALIKYFNTSRFNKEYLTFPSREHTSYEECYKLDFNSVAFELTSGSIHCKLWSEHVAPSFAHYQSFFLHEDSERTDMFKWYEN